MGKTVGIPRSLFFYHFYPAWKTFFEELDVKVVLSDSTNRKILDDGVKSCVDEACLPVKLYHGHVLNLRERVDYLFVPRLISISRNEYICPKFGGLPDMIRNTIKDLPYIIDVEVNLRNSGRDAKKAAMEVGELFRKKRSIIQRAYEEAARSYMEFRHCIKGGVLPCDAIEQGICNKNNLPFAACKTKSSPRKFNIAVIGHAYNLYDNFINLNALKKLGDSGVNIVTIDMIDERIINEKAGTLSKRMFWHFGTNAVGGALHLADREDIDGIIYVMSFGCGIDSFVCDLIERKIRRSKDIPFIILTIDEHSGEAGMNTRIDAFMDMIRWRNRLCK